MNETIVDPIIEFFGWYNLHDIPIDGLHFDFQNQRVILMLDDCDREEQSVEMRLVFKKVSKFTFTYPTDEFLFDMRAVFSAKLVNMPDQTYELQVIIDMPKKDQSIRPIEYAVGEMLIGFADMEVIGGLSREAMEYKWKEENE